MPVRPLDTAARFGRQPLDWLTRRLTRWFGTLPSRIIISVFGAALVTSLAVTWTSTRSIESFLRAKIDRKFPAILRSVDERLELFYSQRELDVATFARSAVVASGLERLQAGGGEARRAHEELRQYLTYVLERFPQFGTLLVLAGDGDVLLHVGDPFEASAAERASLARVRAPQVGELARPGAPRQQIVSTAIVGVDESVLGSLHALLRDAGIEESLQTEDLGASGGVYVVSPDGSVVLHSPGSTSRARFDRPLPGPGALAEVEEYRHADGTHVVGSALAFGRFGWTLSVEEAYEEAFAPVVSVVREILGINLGIVIVFGLLAYLIARSIVRPVLALSDAALRIATGEVDVAIEETASSGEIGVLTRAFNEMSRKLREKDAELEANRIEIEDANARLVAQNRELQRVNEVFQQLSITDDLTKLHNHRFFQDHLPREIKRAERTREPLCLILIDIDDFKRLNDRFGHAVGDAVLRKVADVMNRCVRDTDLLARYGGEEFALLASRTDLEGAVHLAEKVRLAISRARFSVVDLDGPKQIQVTASVGVADYRGDEKALFNAADRALYQAKATGKDCVVVAS